MLVAHSTSASKRIVHLCTVPGLLRTTLEAQETRGLTRSDDISRLLPAEAAMLARGREVRVGLPVLRYEHVFARPCPAHLCYRDILLCCQLHSRLVWRKLG